MPKILVIERLSAGSYFIGLFFVGSFIFCSGECSAEVTKSPALAGINPTSTGSTLTIPPVATTVAVTLAAIAKNVSASVAKSNARSTGAQVAVAKFDSISGAGIFSKDVLPALEDFAKWSSASLGGKTYYSAKNPSERLMVSLAILGGVLTKGSGKFTQRELLGYKNNDSIPFASPENDKPVTLRGAWANATTDYKNLVRYAAEKYPTSFERQGQTLEYIKNSLLVIGSGADRKFTDQPG